MIDELERLTRLWNEGALTKEQFEREKSRLLDQGDGALDRGASAAAGTPRRRTGLIAGGIAAVLLAGVGAGVVLNSHGSHDSAASAENVAANVADNASEETNQSSATSAEATATTSSGPQDAYAVAGQPWKTVSAFPDVMQGDFIPPDRVGGCDNPFMTFHASTFDRNVFGKIFTQQPAQIAVSGTRVWVQNEGNSFSGGIVYEIQSDGSLMEIVNIAPSGTPGPTSGNDHLLRCSAMPQSSAAAPAGGAGVDGTPSDHNQAVAANRTSTQAIMAAWTAIASPRRAELLPEQRRWIKSKDASCAAQAAAVSQDATERETAQLNCDTAANRSRIDWLRQNGSGD